MLKKLKARVLGSFNYNLSVKTATGRLKLPVIHNVGRAHLDEHDAHIGVVLERLYRPGTLLIDVGVNIGQTLVKYAGMAGTGCRYIGFEPNIKAASYVDEIIIQNELKNAIIVPVGLAANTGVAELSMASAGSTDPGASLNHQIRDPEFYGARKTIVTFNGDEIVDQLRIPLGPIIIKIDVEGAELEAISGLAKTIRGRRPFVILEILPPSNFSDGVNIYRADQANKIKQYMAELDYSEYTIEKDGSLDMGTSPTSDYLFIPFEKLEDVGPELGLYENEE